MRGLSIFLSLCLISCIDDMNVRKMIPFLGEVIPEVAWYLSGGIPESTDYTVYDPLAASSQANSYINLTNPGTRDANPVVAPSWSANSGWTFNGTTQYIDSQTIFSANSTIIIWFENWAGVYVCGSTKVLFRPVLTGTTRLTTTGNTDINGETTGGILGVRCGLNAFKDGLQFGAMGAFPAGTDYSVFLGCRNNAGSPANFGSGRILRYAQYNFKLSDAQVQAVTTSMLDYQLPAIDAYSTQVLSLNPICYYPCSQAYGSPLFDISGNEAHGDSRYLPVGQSGLYGNSVAGDGTLNGYLKTFDDWAGKTGFNMDEFSASCWIKVQSDATNQIRVFNIYSNSSTEYCSIEIRSGLQVGIFGRENGVNDSSHSNIVSLTNNTWQQLVFYNSKSGGVWGIYLDGVKYEFVRTLGGFVDTTPDFGRPTMMEDMLGNMQHIAFYDHALSQSEVNILN